MLRCEKKMTNLFFRPSSPSLVFCFSKKKNLYNLKKKKKKRSEEEEEISFQTIKENNLIISFFGFFIQSCVYEMYKTKLSYICGAIKFNHEG